ncbi:alpha-tocopherol transfer protein-like [Pomacea canaliculata]|uniref:alpha-tocopherol transfer protein-like n=1 Tax=Pomacea canaliculata TaxID=400727 RepID=UPI000D7343F8|nr:alpha-tocopherol transfer protein-like [Pomacea canaliculata]XP_025091418.1 alpha-tocopherol transfer protein-like [Pomacea canaliculata]XP_025091419.1 alpha-tocopherol transfer protein-like [Pomacea canaliculata]XP_025091420.1 alpha-tocopherol transfer protein-like [Pomacea canaliculata]XP_025091421.1 alpha-tocopherol transfer protein-like [Pomacea canaliculata]
MASDYTCTLKEETLQLAIKELNENPKTRILEVKAFRERILQYTGLQPRTDTEFLLRFLRARKFDQERAFQLYLSYYRMRKEDPKIFTGLKPSCVRHMYQSAMSFPHTHRDREGCQIYLIFPGRLDTSHYTIEEAFKVEFLNVNKMIEDEENQVRGFTLLIDYRDFSMSHFMMMNFDFAKRVSKLWQDAFPARFKACLLVNVPSFVDIVITLFTQFLKSKLAQRVHNIGSDWKKLHEYIDPSCLPVDYGGTLPGLPTNESWVEEMMKCDEKMEKESKFGFVDDTLGKDSDRKQQDAITNMVGSYKKLSTD